MNEYCRIGRLGNSSITFFKPRLVFGINGGPQPSGFRFIGTADYKDTETLKSCHKEFRLFPPMRLPIESRFAKRSDQFAVCFFQFAPVSTSGHGRGLSGSDDQQPL